MSTAEEEVRRLELLLAAMDAEYSRLRQMETRLWSDGRWYDQLGGKPEDFQVIDAAIAVNIKQYKCIREKQYKCIRDKLRRLA